MLFRFNSTIQLSISIMDQQYTKRKQSQKQIDSRSSQHDQNPSRNLYALIGCQTWQMSPYRSKLELNSIGSGKSRQSRDSDLLNRLGKQPSKCSSKSLSRNNNSKININAKTLMSSNSNSLLSDASGKHDHGENNKMIQIKEAPKIHNCVCFVAGQCLSYNCNCFLSPFPCAPECCPNCLTLKATLPLKISNICSCKKTKCLKLYCECLSNGVYCSVMCRCQLCENHEHSSTRQSLQPILVSKGCTCQKSQCLKKYCECYSQGLKCTQKCNCYDCKNFIQLIKMEEEKPSKQQTHQSMDIELPQLQFQPIVFFSKGKK